MELDTALAIFRELEKATYGWVDDLEGKGKTAPVYTVRLDALVANSEDDERYYTLFVRLTPGAAVSEEAQDHLRFVLDQAQEHGAVPALENAGLSLS